MYFSLIYFCHCFFSLLNFTISISLDISISLWSCPAPGAVSTLFVLLCFRRPPPPPAHHSNYWLPLGNPREPGRRYDYDYSKHYRDICLPLVILSVFSNFPKSSSHERSLINTKAISGLIQMQINVAHVPHYSACTSQVP